MSDKKQQPDKYVVGRTLSSYSPSHRPPIKVEPVSVVKAAKVPKKLSWKKGLVLLLVSLFIPILIVGIWDFYNYSRASQKLFGTGNLLATANPETLSKDSNGRVNIMIVGYSTDDPDHAGASLTDSIMIVSLSTTSKAGYMLSIPRDLYVTIPGSGRAKINEAYQDGEANKFSEADYPEGGMGLLEKTIAESFGIQVDYHVLLNYGAVRDITDALEGITVNIQSSDPRGIYDPNFQPEEGGALRLPNGSQNIDGQTALRLTRARGAAGGYGLAQSDFDRTHNQQAVMVGIKNAINWPLLLNPTRNDKLLDSFADNIQTDVELNEALPLFRLFNDVPSTAMKSVNLRDFNGVNLLRGYTTPTGQSALIPAAGINDYSDIQTALTKLN